jgi:hypothetical protein
MTPQTDTDTGYDAQDRAEVLDETNLTQDGRGIANFDEISDVYDATSAADDGDVDGLDAAADEEDFDPDNFDDGDLTEERDDEGLRASPEDRSFAADEDRVSDDDEDAAGYEAGGAEKDDKEEAVDPADKVDDESDPHVERQLDKGLKETFPASDPVSINPGAD